MPAKYGTGSKMSVLLTSKFSAAGFTVSVALWLLLPLLPPAGFSTLVVVTLAVLVTLRTALPTRKLGRTTSTTCSVTPLASAPMVQLKPGAAGVIWLPALIEQVEPALVELTEITVNPVSPTAKVKLSPTTTLAAAEGPLLRKDNT